MSDFLKISINSVVLPVKANIAQSLIGDWECIVVADREGLRGVPPLPGIKYPMKVK